MRLRILCVGADARLLRTRKMLLASRGYNTSSATPLDVDAKIAEAEFDLVILSVSLGGEEKSRVVSILPPGTRVLPLNYLVQPDELFEMITRAIGPGEPVTGESSPANS
jgi:DNA-binding response OmpR family regulator